MSEKQRIVAVDLDATLTNEPFTSSKIIPPPSLEGVKLLRTLKADGFNVVIHTGRIDEGMDEMERMHAAAQVERWLADHGIGDLVARVWPWPKPTSNAFVDDRAVTWRGFASKRLVSEIAVADQHCRRKRRILILSPLSDRYSGVGNYGFPAIGVWRLRANCLAAGVHADVWDCNCGEEVPPCDDPAKLVEALCANIESLHDVPSYDWIGFSVLNDTLPLTLGLANLLRKKYPDVRLVAGNAEATLNYQDILDKAPFDACLVGEADASLPQLVMGEDPRRIEGVIWFSRARRMSAEEFNGYYAAMNFSDMPLREYAIKTARMYSIGDLVTKWIDDGVYDESLIPAGTDKAFALKKLYACCTVRAVTMDHCPLPCTYCSTARIPDFATGKFQNATFMKISTVRELFLKIKREVPWTCAIYDDSDETFLGTKRGLEYALMLASIKAAMDVGTPRGFRFLVQTRSNEMTRELVRQLAAGGVEHLTFGVENASAFVRDSMRKRQDGTQVANIIAWCQEFGVQCYILLIMFPPETRIIDLEENVRVIREWIAAGAHVSVEPYLMPYRGTPILDDPRYTYEHVTYDIPFSGPPTKRLKWPTLILPRDPVVRGFLYYFREKLDAKIRAEQAKTGQQHTPKGFVGKVAIQHLADCLDDWRAGRVAPDGGSVNVGERAPVYQDYADQESGFKVREDARAKTTMQGTRFNTTHGVLDSVAGLKQGGIKSIAQKDPAAPGEMILPESSNG